MASNLPLTIQTVVGSAGSDNSSFVVGTNRIYPQTNQTLQNVYWAVVLDRSSLKVVLNITFSDNQNIPVQLNPYINNSNYILVLTTSNLQSPNLPAGAFYHFLTSLGAGRELQRIEQIFAALNCGTWGNLAYTLVGVMDGSECVEYSEYQNSLVVYTLQFIPVSVGSSVLYTPVQL